MTRDYAIIPVKGLLESKSRLSQALAQNDKKKLILAMLTDVLTAVSDSDLFAKVLVVSPDRNVGTEADLSDASFVHQESHGLNAGIKQATHLAKLEKASSVTVLLADIPLIEPRNLKELLVEGTSPEKVILAPSLKGGTNVMIREPPEIIATAYGRWSYSNHLRAAQKAGVAVYSISNSRLSFDVDTPDDLKALLKKDPQGSTLSAKCLREIPPLQPLARTMR